MRHWLLVLSCLGLFSSLTQAANYYVTVAGLGGVPEYEKAFAQLAKDLNTVLVSRGADSHVVTLSGPGATRQAMKQTLAQVAQAITADDTFSLFLIGHGTFDGDTYKFNLPGPDVTSQELAVLLKEIPARKQLVVDMSSCSGAAFQPLASHGRIVITATRSGTERNAPVFARYWVDALKDPAADADKNGVVTALEAYNFANRKIKAHYDAEKLLTTEHSMMTPATDKSVVASLYPVLPRRGIDVVAQAKGPAAERARQLEAQIDKLKQSKSSIKPDAYKQQLTALLLELARTDSEINP